MATLGITALQYFQDIGFDAALIYRRDRVEEASQTAFYTVILTSFVVYGVAVLTAPWIAAFFREPNVVPVLRALAWIVPITSFGRIPYILLSREMNFRRKVIPELVANVVGERRLDRTSLVRVWCLEPGLGATSTCDAQHDPGLVRLSLAPSVAV